MLTYLVAPRLFFTKDDILLYHPISLPKDLEHLQKDVDVLQIYAKTNYLTFNVLKCKFMLVSRKKQHTNLAPSISVYGCGSPLESTTTFKYLGLTIVSDLSLTTRIDNIDNIAFWDWCTDVFTSTDMKTLHQLYAYLHNTQ